LNSKSPQISPTEHNLKDTNIKVQYKQKLNPFHIINNEEGKSEVRFCHENKKCTKSLNENPKHFK